jgi:aspartate aminotransferase
MYKIQGQVTSGTNSIAQRATITAVDADPSVLKHMMLIARDLVVGLLQDIPGIKINVPGAFYVFPDVSSFFGKTLKGTEIKNAMDLSCIFGQANVTVTGDIWKPTVFVSLMQLAMKF